MYNYEGSRSIESWSNFAASDYSGIEGEDTPLEASTWKDFSKELSRFNNQVMWLIQNKPLIFIAILGGIVCMITLSFYCVSWATEKFSFEEEEDPKRTSLNKAEKNIFTASESGKAKTE